MEPLLPPTRGLLLVPNEVMGLPPPLTEHPSPLTRFLSTAGEGLAAVPKIGSSLRLTEGSSSEPHCGEKLLLVPGAVAADEEDNDNLEATASWRACGDNNSKELQHEICFGYLH